jgi:Tfp pilus assembly protein PilE
MVYLIIIAILCLILVLFGIYHMFCMKKNAEFAAEVMERLDEANERYTDLNEKYSKTLEKFAERLDVHAQNLDILSNKNRSLQEELEQFDCKYVRLHQTNEDLRAENNILSGLNRLDESTDYTKYSQDEELKEMDEDEDEEEETTDGTEE